MIPTPGEEGEVQKVPRPSALVFLLVLCAVAFSVRLYHLDYQSLWRDEVDSLLFAARTLPEGLATFGRTGENGPLYFLALRWWVRLAGESELALRYPSLLFGVLAVPLAFVLGRRLLGRGAAVAGALVVALSPYFVWYSQEGRMYTAFAFLAAFSLYLYLRAWDRGGAGVWAAFVVVTSAGLYVHLFWGLVLVLEAALVGPLAWRYHRLPRGLALAGAALVLPYLPLAAWQLPVLLQPPPSAYPFRPLPELVGLLLAAVTPARGLGPAWVGAALFLFLALVGLLPGVQKAVRGTGQPRLAWPRPGLGESVLLICVVVPIGVYYLVSLRLPVFAERYLVVVALPFYLLVGAGLDVLRRRSRLIFAAGLAGVLGGAAFSLAAQASSPTKSDFRAAAAEVAGQAQPGDLVLFLMPHVRHTFAYYYDGDLSPADGRGAPAAALGAGPRDRSPSPGGSEGPPALEWGDPPYTNGGATVAEVDAALRRIVAERQRVWLVVSEAELQDARGLVGEWLAGHGRLLAEGHFTRVEVRLYSLDRGATTLGSRGSRGWSPPLQAYFSAASLARRVHTCSRSGWPASVCSSRSTTCT